MCNMFIIRLGGKEMLWSENLLAIIIHSYSYAHRIGAEIRD